MQTSMWLIVLSNVFTFLTTQTKNSLCWWISVVMCGMAHNHRHPPTRILYSFFSILQVSSQLHTCHTLRPLTQQTKQNGICIPGNKSLWTAVAVKRSACESQCVWPKRSPARSSQPTILLLLWWVWLMTSSGLRCHIGPPLIVQSTASVGPDNRIRPAPYRLAGASQD